MSARSPSGDRPVFGEAFYGLLGPLVWALHFGAIYLGHHLACETALRGGRAIDLFVLAVTGVAALVLGFGVAAPRITRRLMRLSDTSHSIDTFMTAAMRVLSLLSLFGVLWAGAAALFVAACTP